MRPPVTPFTCIPCDVVPFLALRRTRSNRCRSSGCLHLAFRGVNVTRPSLAKMPCQSAVNVCPDGFCRFSGGLNLAYGT